MFSIAFSTIIYVPALFQMYLNNFLCNLDLILDLSSFALYNGSDKDSS